jgi:hypothetical protein
MTTWPASRGNRSLATVVRPLSHRSGPAATFPRTARPSRMPTLPRLLAAALLAFLAAAPARTDPVREAAGAGPPAWWLRLAVHDLQGRPCQPSGRWLVVIFLGQECPVSNASIPALNRLAAEFGPRGFSFLGAYVDPNTEPAALRAHAADFAIGFDTVDDRAHRLAAAAGAAYTPEVAVFSRGGDRLYLGRIDDRVDPSGAARPAATHEDLRRVLQALAAGSPGPFAANPGYGCAIPEAVHP